MEDYFENALFGTPFTSAVIVAAGSSTRMGGEDKQFIRLCGKPILAHSMTAFQNCPVIEEIVVVTKADSVEAVRAMAAEYGIDKLTAVTEGGASRAESVRNGVAAVSCGAEFVAIHDGARPLVTPEDIARCATDAFRCGGAVLAVPVTDTVKYGRKNGFVEYTPAREKLLRRRRRRFLTLKFIAPLWKERFASFLTGQTTAVFLKMTAEGYFSLQATEKI